MASNDPVMSALNSITASLAKIESENKQRDGMINHLIEATKRVQRNRPSILASPGLDKKVKFEEPNSAMRTPRPDEEDDLQMEEEVLEGIFIPRTRDTRWNTITAQEIDEEFIDKITQSNNRTVVSAIVAVMKRAQFYGLPWYRMNAQLLLEGGRMRTTDREELESRIKKYQATKYNKPQGTARTPNRNRGGYNQGGAQKRYQTPKQNFRA